MKLLLCTRPVLQRRKGTGAGKLAPFYVKHFFLAESDYAASGNMFSQALRAVGEETLCLIARSHIFKYPEQGEVFTSTEQIRVAIEWADWVWIIQTDLPLKLGGTYGSNICENKHRIAWMEYLKNKKVALLHGGGIYRDHRDFYRNLWKPFNPLSICYEADLMGSFENEHLVIPPVNLDHFKQKNRTWDVLRVGHFPSRPTDKGSEWIVPMMKGTKDVELRTSVSDPFDSERGSERKPWLEHLERMSVCDVIIDQIKPVLNGKKFGEWVSIGTEAAALGCISIANSLDQQPYYKTYGRFPGIHVCNDSAELILEIERIKTLPPLNLADEKQKSRDWIQEYHTLEPTGKVLKRLCNIQ